MGLCADAALSGNGDDASAVGGLDEALWAEPVTSEDGDERPRAAGDAQAAEALHADTALSEDGDDEELGPAASEDEEALLAFALALSLEAIGAREAPATEVAPSRAPAAATLGSGPAGGGKLPRFNDTLSPGRRS